MKHKTRTERVYNESTGWYETREVELKGYTFTDDDRILIVREYLESGVSAAQIIKKNHISSRTVLFSWMDKFLNEKDSLPLQQKPVDDDDMAKTKDERLKAKVLPFTSSASDSMSAVSAFAFCSLRNESDSCNSARRAVSSSVLNDFFLLKTLYFLINSMYLSHKCLIILRHSINLYLSLSIQKGEDCLKVLCGK